MDPWVDAVLQFGALGVLCAVLVWIFKGMMPRIFDEQTRAREAFQAELAIDRDRNCAAWEAFRVELAAERATFREALTEIRQGCPHAD